MKLRQAILVALSASTLVACGNSSGISAGGTTPPVGGGSAAVIDNTNATTVASTAAGAALASAELGGMTDGIGIIAVAPGGGVTKPNPMDSALSLAKGRIDESVISGVPIPAIELPCEISGSMTISGDVANPEQLSAGDEFTIDSDNCDNGFGDVVDGLLEMTVTSYDVDAGTGLARVGIDLVITNFAVTIEGETLTANGDIGTVVDSQAPPIITGSVFGQNYSVSFGSVSESLMDFSTTTTEDTSSFPTAFTTDAMGTLTSTEFDGAIDYDTPVVFAGMTGDFPSSGELLVSGADGATLRLIALDNVNVQIDADYDGVDGVDESLFMTWAELTEQ